VSYRPFSWQRFTVALLVSLAGAAVIFGPSLFGMWWAEYVTVPVLCAVGVAALLYAIYDVSHFDDRGCP
jgi:hypothetical protein